MVRAWRFVNVAACRAVSNPAWCRIFREISCLSPLNLGALFRCCVLAWALDLTQVKMITWYGRDDNVYDKFNVYSMYEMAHE